MSKAKVTNVNMLNGLNALISIKDEKLPVKISYGIKKNIEILSKELVPYDKEREELINKYGQKELDGKLKIKDNNYIIEDIPNFNKDIIELQNIENEIDVHYISLDILLNSDAEMSTAELTAIEFMLKEN